MHKSDRRPHRYRSALATAIALLFLLFSSSSLIIAGHDISKVQGANAERGTIQLKASSFSVNNLEKNNMSLRASDAATTISVQSDEDAFKPDYTLSASGKTMTLRTGGSEGQKQQQEFAVHLNLFLSVSKSTDRLVKMDILGGILKMVSNDDADNPSGQTTLEQPIASGSVYYLKANRQIFIHGLIPIDNTISDNNFERTTTCHQLLKIISKLPNPRNLSELPSKESDLPYRFSSSIHDNNRLGKDLYLRQLTGEVKVTKASELLTFLQNHTLYNQIKKVQNGNDSKHSRCLANSGFGNLVYNPKSTKVKGDKNGIVGAYAPSGVELEGLRGSDQIRAISNFLARGFDEYYFVMHDFRDVQEANNTELLLDAADKTELKTVVILLPPSEGSPGGNYDWYGWIDYFDKLKAHHISLAGFAIDDFNWISTRKDTKFWKNIDFMLYSDLYGALEHKRVDLKFYPVIYFEGLGTDVIADSQHAMYADTVLLVSASYYNVSSLEKNLVQFKEMFPGKLAYYIVYPTITYNYTRQGYGPPSDRLVMATLSIASRVVDGIIVWHNIDSPVIQDFLHYRQNPRYLEEIAAMERLQITDEKRPRTEP